MGTLAEYEAVKAALLKAFTVEENADYRFFERPFIPPQFLPALVDIGSKVAIDTLDKMRTK